MEKTNNPTGAALAISPQTQEFLLSLQAIATAREHYFNALCLMIGEDAAADLWKEKAAAPFDTAAQAVEAQLADAVHDWATAAPPRAEI